MADVQLDWIHIDLQQLLHFWLNSALSLTIVHDQTRKPEDDMKPSWCLHPGAPTPGHLGNSASSWIISCQPTLPLVWGLMHRGMPCAYSLAQSHRSPRIILTPSIYCWSSQGERMQFPQATVSGTCKTRQANSKGKSKIWHQAQHAGNDGVNAAVNVVFSSSRSW